jgi:outer membrane assembly lipoprotein YfiO
MSSARSSRSTSDAWKQINKNGNWENAAKQFDEVERQHPYSVWARRAMLMSAFCYYQANKYTDAISTADEYIQLHPGSREVAYAFYLKAMSLYEQIVDVESRPVQHRAGADRAAGRRAALSQHRICARRRA